MSVIWVEFKGKNILFADYTNMKEPKELIEVLDKTMSMAKQSLEKEILLLEDFSNAVVGKEYMEKTKSDSRKLNRDKKFKIALIGINGLKKVLVNGYIRYTKANMKIFKNGEAAKEYLVKG